MSSLGFTFGLGLMKGTEFGYIDGEVFNTLNVSEWFSKEENYSAEFEEDDKE